MARERTDPPAAEPTTGPTQYLVFQRHSEGEIPTPGAKVEGEAAPTTAVELFALLPGTFTGDPVRTAAEKHGPGEYIPVPVRSGKRRTVTVETQTRVKVS